MTAIGEIIDIPGIGRCEHVASDRTCANQDDNCALYRVDLGETSSICLTRPELCHIRCGKRTCFRLIEVAP
jgi:hypothetical protein